MIENHPEYYLGPIVDENSLDKEKNSPALRLSDVEVILPAGELIFADGSVGHDVPDKSDDRDYENPEF